MNEPVADTLRATLDGHIVLSRELANAGQYPAIDVLQSVSRLHNTVGKPEDLAAARKVLACCALYDRNRQLIELGVYKAGVSPSLDRAVQVMPRIQAYFSQAMDNQTPRDESLAQLRNLAMSLGDDREIK